MSDHAEPPADEGLSTEGPSADHYSSDDGSTDGFSTGDAEVDAAINELDALDTTTVDEHAGAYEGVHRRLGAVLDGPGDGPRDGQ